MIIKIMIITIIMLEAINHETEAKTEATKLDLKAMPRMTDDDHEPQNRRRSRKRKQKRRENRGRGRRRYEELQNKKLNLVAISISGR